MLKNSPKYGIETTAPTAITTALMPPTIIAKSAKPFAKVPTPIFPIIAKAALNPAIGKAACVNPQKTSFIVSKPTDIISLSPRNFH